MQILEKKLNIDLIFCHRSGINKRGDHLGTWKREKCQKIVKSNHEENTKYNFKWLDNAPRKPKKLGLFLFLESIPHAIL